MIPKQTREQNNTQVPEVTPPEAAKALSEITVEINAALLQILVAAVDVASQKGVFLANQLSTVGRAFDNAVAILEGALK